MVKNSDKSFSATLPTALAADPVLRLYSWALLLGHANFFVYFLRAGRAGDILKTTTPWCWPFFQSCNAVRLNSVNESYVLFGAYFSLTLVAAVFLARKQWRIFSYFVAILLATLMAITFLDYRFSCNQFYMFTWINLVFLVWPFKRNSIPILLGGFYFWAGYLKLNFEWLSGSVLYADLWLIPKRFVSLACSYAVLLEMVLIFGLYAKSRLLRWVTLFQLGLFHIQSLSQIDYFYPILMTCLLSIFPITWMTEKKEDPQSILDFPGAKWAVTLFAVFSTFQILPNLYHGDRVLNGQGRIFALYMLQARQVCDVTFIRHDRNGLISRQTIKQAEWDPRLECDPIVYYNEALAYCRAWQNDPNFVDFDFEMNVKRTTDKSMTTIVHAPQFCQKKYKYRIVGSNSWIVN